MINVSADEIAATDTTHRVIAAAMTILLMGTSFWSNGSEVRCGRATDVTIVERLCERGVYPIAHRGAKSWDYDNALARSLFEAIEPRVSLTDEGS